MNSARARANIDNKVVMKLSQDLSLQTVKMQPLKESSGSNVLREYMSSAEAILMLSSWLEGHVHDLDSDDSSYAQLSHAHSTDLSPLFKNKRDKEQSKNMRTVPKICTSSNVTFLS